MPLSFRVDVYHHLGDVSLIPYLEKLMTTQTELAASINSVAATVTKIGDETRTLLAKIAELQQAVIDAGNVTPEVQAAMDGLTAQVQVVDELVPDAEPTPAG